MPKGRRPFDIAGQRFGRLVAIRRGERRRGGYAWECACDCGGTHSAIVAHLKSGQVRSCGCLHRDTIAAPRPRQRIRPYEPLFNKIVARSRERGIECALTYEEFLLFTTRVTCDYCGAAVVWSKHPTTGETRRTNLDRKDSTRGYESDNLVVCCWKCNEGKGARYSHGEWKAMTEALRRYREACDQDPPCDRGGPP